VADSEEMKALLLGAAAMHSEPLSFLLPVRQAKLFRWCLSEDFRAIIPMTLMAMGIRVPTAATSVLFNTNGFRLELCVFQA
jgi:hypothetical protein